MFLASLEKDARALLNTPASDFGYLTLAMVAAMRGEKQPFDEYLKFPRMTADDVSVTDIFVLNGLNRMGCFDEANAYLQTLFIKSADSNDLHILKPLLHVAMLYGFLDDAGLLLDKLKKLNAIEAGYNTHWERVYLLLRELQLPQSAMVAAILAVKKFIFLKV